MKYLLLSLCIFVAGCQGSARSEARGNSEFARRLSCALEVNGVRSTNDFFSPDQLEQLRRYKFVDHLPLPNVLYYDRVWNVGMREVKRFYLNASGDIAREEIISLPERNFWKPIQALADYYEEYHRLPAGSNLVIPLLEGEVTKHRSSGST